MYNHEDLAFTILMNNLIEKVLSLSGDPGSCVQFTAESLRELIGARTVLVIECSSLSAKHQHEVVSIFPKRRTELAQRKEIQRLAELSHTLNSACLKTPDESEPISEQLKLLDAGPSILAPLITGHERIGLLLLLDLMDTNNLTNIIETLNNLSRILALILRNAFLYQKMGEEVESRTEELQEKNIVLEKTLRERDLMLKEIHHRVKNNLQIINSLLYLQASNSSDPHLKEALEKVQHRIYSMALVHEQMYQSEDLELIDIIDYTKRLCETLEFDNFTNTIDIQVHSDLASLMLPITYSVPLGIMLNELITNAVKYAYPNNCEGIISIGIQKADKSVILVIEDEGIGISQTIHEDIHTSLGLSLVKNLAEQIHGTFTIENRSLIKTGKKGTVATVIFPWE